MIALALAAALSLARPADLNATPTLVAETVGVAPGQTVWVGVRFTIREGWHIYWKGLNDTGHPPEVTFHLPEGFTVGDLVWPAPERHVSEGDILDHVYEREALLLAPLSAPPDARPGSTVTLQADLAWLVCKDVCIPERGHVSLSLPIVDAAQAKPGKDAGLFRQFRERVPTPLPPDIKIHVRPDQATIEVPGASALEFYPGEDSIPLAEPIQDASKKGTQLMIRLAPPTDDRKHLPARLTGVLKVVRAAGGRPAYYSVLKDVER